MALLVESERVRAIHIESGLMWNGLDCTVHIPYFSLVVQKEDNSRQKSFFFGIKSYPSPMGGRESVLWG